MTNRNDSRARAIETAEHLFRTQGYAATGLTQILTESGAPKGSFYFHFPGGKEELAREALGKYGTRVESGLRALLARHADDSSGFVRALCRSIAAEMQASDWKLGCLAQNLATELAPADDKMADAIAEVFRAWTRVLAEGLAGRRPAPRGELERKAATLLAALEGARTLARVVRKPAPFDAVAEVMMNKVK
jgi:TetR/AcrR family transcriptional repressor of lmrAB and yxaGH operons